MKNLIAVLTFLTFCESVTAGTWSTPNEDYSKAFSARKEVPQDAQYFTDKRKSGECITGAVHKFYDIEKDKRKMKASFYSQKCNETTVAVK